MSRNSSEKGQAIMLYAVMIPLSVLFALGIMDYMVTTVRLMAAVAAADLAAHAGAQVVRIQPGGRIVPDLPAAEQTAAAYFTAQAPNSSVLTGASCGLRAGRPNCQVTASVRSAGFLLPARWIQVDAVGALAYGATRDDQ